jgi:regulator of protease activity HflC (stomatin/prohibitin superfamily)
MTLNQKIFSGCALLLAAMGALALTVWFMMTETAQDAEGVKVNRVELQDINPPLASRDAMEKQMRAERTRLATFLLAQG